MGDIDSGVEALFEYLRAALYDPANARLDVEALPLELQKLGEGLRFYVKCAMETQELARALSRGDLSVTLPPRDNEMAAPLKALHASLRHMTWQSQQVAKGDYRQRLEFMGDFAAAFNTMTEQLDQRQCALEAEIEAGRKKTLALEQSNSLFEAVTTESALLIFVLDRATGEQLFVNAAARQALAPGSGSASALQAWLDGLEAPAVFGNETLTLMGDAGMVYMAVHAYPVQWRQWDAVTYVLQDITQEETEVRQLKSVAYSDTLTQAHNRYYGMKQLRAWVEEKQSFCLCFIDIDNLKYVNDQYGHAEGDRYIIEATSLLKGFSPRASLCRLGGDEFMLLVPGYTARQVEEKLKALRDSFLSCGGDGETACYLHSISYGVVEVDEDNTLGASALLGLADERMYAFKRKYKQQRQDLAAGE